MIRLAIDLDSVADAAALVEVLLAAATRAERSRPALSALWRELADGIGDGLDTAGAAGLSDGEVIAMLAACGLDAAA